MSLMLRLIFNRSNRIHVSLWAEFADKVTRFFETHDGSSPVILILQFCKTRKYMGMHILLTTMVLSTLIF